jgi:hypothetical protein
MNSKFTKGRIDVPAPGSNQSVKNQFDFLRALGVTDVTQAPVEHFKFPGCPRQRAGLVNHAETKKEKHAN